MAYITYEQYTELYGAPPISEDAFPVYAGQASDLIDSITQYRIIQGGGLSALPACIQTLVQKAAAGPGIVFHSTGHGNCAGRRNRPILHGGQGLCFRRGTRSRQQRYGSFQDDKPAGRYAVRANPLAGKEGGGMLRPIPGVLLKDKMQLNVCTGLEL